MYAVLNVVKHSTQQNLMIKAQKGEEIMAKIKMTYNPLNKEEQDKFDKSQQEFYEKYIKVQKGENI